MNRGAAERRNIAPARMPNSTRPVGNKTTMVALTPPAVCGPGASILRTIIKDSAAWLDQALNYHAGMLRAALRRSHEETQAMNCMLHASRPRSI